MAAAFWGCSNFFYSLLNSHDFPTICLSWTGFFFTSLAYRCLNYQERNDTHHPASSLVSQIISFLRNPIYRFHHTFRTLNWFAYIWFTIIVGQYSTRAEINPGIAYGCLSTSIIFTSVMSWVVFKERMGWKMCFGVALVLISVVMLSTAGIAHSGPLASGSSEPSKVRKFRVWAIALALLCALVASFRPI